MKPGHKEIFCDIFRILTNNCPIDSKSFNQIYPDFMQLFIFSRGFKYYFWLILTLMPDTSEVYLELASSPTHNCILVQTLIDLFEQHIIYT